jgi:small-conductance mechanosensitive channel
VSGLAVLFAAAYAMLGLALFHIVRRERRRGAASTTHPFLIGLYRGLVLVVVLFAVYAVIGVLFGALGLAPNSHVVPVVSLL